MIELNITILQINDSHIAALQQIGRQTFEETFAESNSAENMAKYLEEAYSYEKLSAELNDPDSFFYNEEKGNHNSHGKAGQASERKKSVDLSHVTNFKNSPGDKYACKHSGS